MRNEQRTIRVDAANRHAHYFGKKLHICAGIMRYIGYKVMPLPFFAHDSNLRSVVIVDAIDRQILAAMQHNARTPVSEIARLVGLSSAPVSRRIEKLERTGVIQGYVALVDDRKVGGLEAFIEARLAGGEDTTELEAVIRKIDEIRDY